MTMTDRLKHAVLRRADRGTKTEHRMSRRYRGEPGVPVEIRNCYGVSPYFDTKRRVSIVLGSLFLLLLFPVMVLTAIVVAVFSPGPVFYRQRRLGRYGEEFTILKFRTMRVDAESKTGPVWSTRGDTRVTRIGRFLRATHLDELPQLINVLRGDMDLVGPRPERPELVSQLVEKVIDYEARLLVRPGITGLAQVQLPPDETLDCVRQKVRVDLQYIREGSFKLDLQILACTVAKPLGLGKPMARWFFGRDNGSDRQAIASECVL